MARKTRTRAGSNVFLFGLLLLVSAPAMAQDDCLVCHGEASMFEDTEDGARMVVTEQSHAASLHGEAGLGCVDCHVDLDGVEDFPHAEQLAPAECGGCHVEVQEIYDGSLHGYAVRRGNPRAPDCSGCHGAHDILPVSDVRSPVQPDHVAGMCAGCHGAAGLLTDQLVKLPENVTAYARSVHGNGTDNGTHVVATCVDCHGVHDLRGPGDPKSRINLVNVAATCGECHPDVRQEYDKSIHGLALQAGVTDSPTCTGCHGEHLILSSKDPDSKTYSGKLALETCGSCHDDPIIVSKYSLRGEVVGSYVDSYHGWATRRDYESAASCVSCHTAHAVLPESHPESTIHADNLERTCRNCHPNADRRFAASYTHKTASITANPVNRIIRSAYVVAITVIIGLMALHNLVIMNYYIVERRRHERSSASVRRMDHVQIVQHLVLAVAFIVLVVTGFALRYPGAWWVEHLTALGLSEPVRANLHRVFAIVLVALSLSHTYYLLLTRPGMRDLRAKLPVWGDVTGFLENMRFYTWRRREHVRFARYDYTQKAEYWALVWGTVVMMVTGVVLWWPALATKVFPVWMVSASQTVHFYEAWLATLAIIVWHFFFVIFHPEQYPMSWIWLTGKMPRKSVEKHHALWYKQEFAQAENPGAEKQGDRVPGGPKAARKKGDETA